MDNRANVENAEEYLGDIEPTKRINWTQPVEREICKLIRPT